MSISKWLKIDLHIHSIESNKTKSNDYSGNKYDVNKLIKKLKKEKINIFSITDHNTINTDLYEELLERQHELIEQDLNFVIGVELDIRDLNIYGDKDFHALLFFSSYDLNKINNIITQLTIKGDQIIKPSVNAIFNVMNDNDNRKFILIPHFNNKSKGLKNENMKRDAIDCLNTMVFDAYEDSNNIKKIQESLDVYSKHGYDDLPMFIFSDCHNIDIYPRYKNKSDKLPEFLSVLGSINHPFNSLKLSFQDSKLRIGYDDLHKITNYRTAHSEKNDKYYISEIKINDQIITFSEYQNTIIGGFGSGKSFLMKLLLEGKNNLEETHAMKYGDLLNNVDSFHLKMSDGTYRNSLEEIDKESEIILFEQNEELFYKDIIDEEEKDKLEKKLKIKFPELNIISKYNFDKLDNVINKYKELKLKQITDSFNYEILQDRAFYRVAPQINFYDEESQISDETIESNALLEFLKSEKEKEKLKVEIYSEKEQRQIEETIQLIQVKNDEWKKKINVYDRTLLLLDGKIEIFNTRQSKDEVNIESNIKVYESIKSSIKEIGMALTDIKKECKIFEDKLSEEKYLEYRNKKSTEKYGDYELIKQYKCDNLYKDYKESILKSNYRSESLFNGVVKTIRTKSNFHGNKEFHDNIEDYYNKIFYNNFSEFNYDIRKDNRSIMERSAGEKANLLLELIFSIIEKNINSNKNIILLIDQPEDHLDNKNIDKNIVKKIISMKKNNRFPQFVFVTHNANVAITADSENIIIAKKQDNHCNYTNSGIEDEHFVKEVCKILEGGPSALKRRGMKFSISYIKEYLKRENNDDN